MKGIDEMNKDDGRVPGGGEGNLLQINTQDANEHADV